MMLDDPYQLYDADRGTLSPSGFKIFFKGLEAQGLSYEPYAKRVGPGFATAASELKRVLDREVLPAFQTALKVITNQRFSRAYCDVRLYPQGHELTQWTGGYWAGERLAVVVAFVIAIPLNDSLDSLTRASLLSLFDESPWNPEVKKLGKKSKLWERLNVKTINKILSDMVFEGFSPYELNGFELEIMIDGCHQSRFNRLSTNARGEPIQKARSTRTVFKGVQAHITLDNCSREIPVLIAALAKALGIKNLDPSALRLCDSLYALMRFDDRLTKSLVGSIRLHFDTLGGPGMVTVGDAVVFAREALEMREECP